MAAPNHDGPAEMPPRKSADPDRLSIRHARAADAETIAAIYNQYIDRGNCTMDLAHRPADLMAQQLAALGPREAVLVADLGQRSVAWGAVRRYSDREGYCVCCETSLYVDPQYTRLGIGQLLMDALFQRCEQLGYHHVMVRIFASNDGSLRFHERNGFEVVGTLREVGYVRGQFVDVVVMQRILANVEPEANG